MTDRPAGAASRAPVVTALEPDPRRPGAVRLLVDGAHRSTVDAADAEALGLAPGLAFDAPLAERVDRAADAEATFRTALRALERRAFARVDLGRRLRRKGHPAAAVDAAVARLDRLGLLDDAAFARGYAETRAARGRGPARLRRDLLAMGVADPLVEAAVAAAWADGPTPGPEAGPEGERSPAGRPAEVALSLARKRAAQLAGIPRPALRRRLHAFLARRGFTGDVARRAIAAALRATPAPDPAA